MASNLPYLLTRVRALPNLQLEVMFADGSGGIVTLAELELTGVLAPLRNREYFAQVGLKDGVATWPDGQDLAPDRMHAEVAAAVRGDVALTAHEALVSRFTNSPTKSIEATVLFAIKEWQLTKIETDDGYQYCVVEQTAGVPWDQLQEGDRIRCVVTTDLPRVVRVLGRLAR